MNVQYLLFYTVSNFLHEAKKKYTKMDSKQMEDEVTLMKNFVFDDIDIEFIDDVTLYEYVTKDPNPGCSSNPNQTVQLIESKKNDTVVQNTKQTQSHELNKCHVCNKIFKTKTYLTSHMLSHYNIYFECETCKERFPSSDKLSDHMLTHLDIFNCKWCCLKFITEQELKEHATTHSQLVCKICSIIFSSQVDLAQHASIQHKPIQECVTLDLTGDSDEEILEDLPENAVRENGPNTLLCQICGFKFNEKHHLERHENEVHNEVRPFKCVGCQMSFGRVKTFLEHFKSRSHEGSCKCNLCECEFYESYELIDHVKNKHYE